MVMATATALLVGACEGNSSTKGRRSTTIASTMILGAAVDASSRTDAVSALSKNYGVTFRSVEALAPAVIATSLRSGRIDVASLSSTDPAIKAGNFAVLADAKNTFRAENVVPVITTSKATRGVKQVLNLVSARLTTSDLIDLRRKVEVDKENPDTAAQQWLATRKLPRTIPAAGVSLTVGSANFPENVVIADIYSDALTGAGAKVSKHLNIGSREKYLPGLKDGSINLIPEYSGNLLRYFDKAATATTSDAVFAALQKAIPKGLTVLNQSSAEDRDAIVVTASTAKKYGLKTIADLAKKA